jgi:hypothetical protein
VVPPAVARPEGTGVKQEDDAAPASALTAWLASEARSDAAQWLPHRGGEDDEADDEAMDEARLESVVLFDDVKPFLVSLSDPHILLQLVLHCLEHAGLKTEVPWVGGRASSAPFNVERANEAEEFESTPGLSQLFAAENATPASQTELLWEVDELRSFAAIPAARLDFARNVCALSLQALPSSIRLKTTALLLEAARGGEGKASGVNLARKLAKRFLKADSMNLMLWDAYAQLEKRHGSLQEACNVYNKALSLCPRLPAEQQGPAPLLYWQYAHMELRCSPLSPLISISTPPPISSFLSRSLLLPTLTCTLTRASLF